MESIYDNKDVKVPEFQVVLIVDVEDGRLSPMTNGIPRCLLPLANRCILQYQLDLLATSGISGHNVFVVAPQEYSNVLRQFQSQYTSFRSSLHVDFIFVEDMNGSVDGLRAVSDRIRGEVICLTADVLCQINLSHVVNKHRLSASDITVLLAPVSFEEPVKKGGTRLPVVDEEDREIIGLNGDGRIMIKTALLDVEDDKKITIMKSIIHKCNNLNLRNNLIDVGIYVMSKWIFELVRDKKKLTNIRNDLIPFLVLRQFQSKEYLFEHMPSLAHRKRCLDVLEPWIISSHAGSVPCDLISSLMKSISTKYGNAKESTSLYDSNGKDSSGSLNDHSVDRDDLLRCYAYVYEPIVSEVKDTTIIQRVVNTKTYMILNRDIPLVPHTPSLPWPKLETYMKKESSIFGLGCEISDKVTIQQCTFGYGTKIGTKSKLNNCILMNGVTVGENCVIQNSIVCSNTVIENNCNLNACLIGSNAKVAAGSNIKNEHIVNEDSEDE